MIRKLYFQNARGDRWGLNGDRGVYATNLSGFGFTLAPGFADLGRGFFSSVNDESEPQGTIPFTLYFTRNSYDVYQSLVDWLASAGTITIVYNPNGKREYCRDVIVNFMQKGELTEVGWLEVPSSFFCTTPWYLPAPASLDMGQAGEDDRKTYDYEYDELLCYGENSVNSLSGTVSGAGHIPGALDLVYRGAITNPRIRLVGRSSGKTYGVCNVSAFLGDTDTLDYSSRHDSGHVRKIAVDGSVVDLLDALDLSTNPFFRLPVDESCTVSIESDLPLSGEALLTTYYYYRSV